jgi:hypothetical protein
MDQPTHQIRLRKPWQSDTQADGILLYRRFGLPSHLEPGQTVWLHFPALASLHGVTINGKALPVDVRMWNITAELATRNEIRVHLTDAAEQDMILEHVRLEIVG